jgi:hypothetical protein
MFEQVLSFRNYVLLEDNRVLKQAASEIAERLQSMLNLATTGLVELKGDCEDVFSLIQTMIHGHWLKQQQTFLVPLQTVAYNMKLLADGDKEAKNQDIAAVIKGCLDLINQKILEKIKGPINDLGVMDDSGPPSSEDLGSDQSDKSKVGGDKFDNQTAMVNSMPDNSTIPPLGGPTDEFRPAS